MAFACEQEGWLRRALRRCRTRRRSALGSAAPGRGADAGAGAGHRGGWCGSRAIAAGAGRSGAGGARVAAWLKMLARDRLAAASTAMRGWSGAATASLTLRDTRSRWGSCTADGRLMYSWRLIMAPPAVLDYVAAHEVAHLVEMNHSPGLLGGGVAADPGWQPQRAWLQAAGQTLHGFRFGRIDRAGAGASLGPC